jgi:uncharacterized protein (TIGR02145 family)
MYRSSLFFFILLLNQFFALTVSSQVPDKMVYQVVVRDGRGEPVVNHAVGIRVWILKNNEPVSAVFLETHSLTTNENGLVTLVIGNGNPLLGSLSSIDWADGPYFLQTDTDPSGGTEYSVNTISQIVSVPYAIHAGSAERLTSTIPETDPVFQSSLAKGISGRDIAYWNLKPEYYSETDPIFKEYPAYSITAEDTASWNHKISTENQNLGSVLAKGNDAGGKPIENISSPSDLKDAATKAYVDLLGDRLRMLENTVNAGGAIKDIDGNLYNIVQIGNQLWMAENLRTTRYNDGQNIPHRILNQYDSSVVKTPAYYWYNNDETYKDPYGALYTYTAVTTGKVCPAGWHIPDNAEWDTLSSTLGGSDIAGGKLKEAGTGHWSNSNYGADNSSGFTGLPGGMLLGGAPHLGAGFGFMGAYGFWWSSTPGVCIWNPNPVIIPGSDYRLSNGEKSLTREVAGCYRTEILSARCIKDKAE